MPAFSTRAVVVALSALALVVSPLAAAPASADTVTNSYATGGGPMAIALSPDGLTLYSANFQASSVTFQTASTGAITATLTGLTLVTSLEITPDGTKLVVGGFGPNGYIIDVATQAVTTFPTGNSAFSVAISPDGTTAYVANGFWIQVVDIATATVLPALPSTGLPWAMTATPDGAGLWVADISSSVAYRVDIAAGTIGPSIPVSTDPRAIAISPNGATVYVPGAAGNQLTVIDTATGTVTATIPVGAYPQGVEVSPNGLKVYVPSFIGSDLFILDVPSGTTTTLPIGDGHWAPVFSSDGSKAYISRESVSTITSLSVDLPPVPVVPPVVPPAAPVLAATGLATAPALALGLDLLVAGALLLALRRRLSRVATPAARR